MKITRIRIRKTAVPHVDGFYVWGAGNRIKVAQAPMVGLQGCGQFTSYGDNYMVAKSEGVQALARLLADQPLDVDPCQGAAMDHTMGYSTRSTGIGGAWAENGQQYASRISEGKDT